MPDNYPKPTNIKPPSLGTAACRDYFNTWARIRSFYYWVAYMAGVIDKTQEQAHETLCQIEDDEVKKKKLKDGFENRRTMIDELKSNRQFFMEIIFVRHIEAYLNYLSSLLFEIFTQRPETLKSSEKVDLSTVLSHGTFEELVHAIAERKVENLSYSSFLDLLTYFKDRFALDLFNNEDVVQIIEAVETRNISVHNRCIINNRYLKKVGATSNLIGTQKRLYPIDLERLELLLVKSVLSVDSSVRKKLKIKGTKLSVEPTK